MQILHVCNDYYYSTLYEAFQKALSSRGLDSIIFVPSSFQEGNQQENQKVTQLKCYNKYDRYFYYRKQKKITNVIERHIGNKKPDCLHAHFLFSAGYTCMQIKQKYQIPYIVAVRNTDVNLFLKKMIHLRPVGTQIMLNAEKIVFISPAYRDYVIKQYVHDKYKSIISDKSIVIPNGIDAFWLNNKFVRNIGPENKKLTIIYVGSIDKNKNIEATIRACNLLIEQGYDIKYKIIGKIASSKYSDLISKNSFIEYIPFCEKEELIGHYRNSDIFLMPSIHETFGLVYAEAMSQGLPVIYSKGQGFDGQFEEGEVGFHVESSNAESIVSKLCEIEDNYLDISRRCVLGCEKFNWDTIAAVYADIYKKIVEQKQKEKNI